MILHYDGSLSGFLCLLGKAIKERIEVTAIIRNQQPVTANLFCSTLKIETDSAWAKTVASGLERKLGKRFLNCLAHTLFSENEAIELDLLQFTRRALHEGRGIMTRLADPLVSSINAAALQTVRERHRLLGLLRFTRLADDSYLARIAPRANVVPLLGSHFARRLGGQRWLILDERRKLALQGDNSRWQLIERVEISAEIMLHKNEQQLTKLWREFYQSISNPDRHNPKLRQQFMPKRYWHYLTEFATDSRHWEDEKLSRK